MSHTLLFSTASQITVEKRLQTVPSNEQGVYVTFAKVMHHSVLKEQGVFYRHLLHFTPIYTLRRNSSFHCTSPSHLAIQLYKNSSNLTEMNTYSAVSHLLPRVYLHIWPSCHFKAYLHSQKEKLKLCRFSTYIEIFMFCTQNRGRKFTSKTNTQLGQDNVHLSTLFHYFFARVYYVLKRRTKATYHPHIPLILLNQGHPQNIPGIALRAK